MGVVPAAVSARAPPLPATAFRLPAGRVITDRVITGRVITGRVITAARPTSRAVAARRPLGLLRRRPERQPRQHGHLLGERADLTLQVRDPGLQHDVFHRQALRLGTPELDLAHTTEITAAHDADTRSPQAARVQHPAPTACRSTSQAPSQLRDHRMLTLNWATSSTTYAPARRSPRPVANGRAHGCGRCGPGSPSCTHRSSPTSPASTSHGDNWPDTSPTSRSGNWPSAPDTSRLDTPTAAEPGPTHPRLGITNKNANYRPGHARITERLYATAHDFEAASRRPRRRHPVPNATVPYRATEQALVPKERHDEGHQSTILGNPTRRWRSAHPPRTRSTRGAAATPRPRRTRRAVAAQRIPPASPGHQSQPSTGRSTTQHNDRTR